MRTRNMYKKSTRARRKSRFMILSSLILTLALSLVCGAFFSSAQNESEPELQTYYRSIQIQSGDSLWSICAHHLPNDGRSISQYIHEVAELNQIDLAEDDSIYAGEYLMISYYE